MKRFILIGIALALSWGSCHDSALSEPGDPDGAAMSYRAPDGMTDPGVSADKAEDVILGSLTSLILDMTRTFNSWTEEDLHALLGDDDSVQEYCAGLVAMGSYTTQIQDLSEAVLQLTETRGQTFVEELIREVAASASPIDPSDDSQALDTPCYDKFQTKADLAGVALGACVAATAATAAGPSVCLAVYTATMSIYLREFYRCVTGN